MYTYYHKNKDKIKKYINENKDKIKQYQKEYYKKNILKMKIRNDKYRDARKEYNKKKINMCNCQINFYIDFNE